MIHLELRQTYVQQISHLINKCYGYGLLMIVSLYENAPGLIWGYHYVNFSVFTCILITSQSSKLMYSTEDFNG